MYVSVPILTSVRIIHKRIWIASKNNFVFYSVCPYPDWSTVNNLNNISKCRNCVSRVCRYDPVFFTLVLKLYRSFEDRKFASHVFEEFNVRGCKHHVE